MDTLIRFFLKGKVIHEKASYIGGGGLHKHTVREEVSQVWNEHKIRIYKKQSQVLVMEPKVYFKSAKTFFVTDSKPVLLLMLHSNSWFIIGYFSCFISHLY